LKPYLIGIAGPSCAGKSFLAAHIAEQLDAAIFSLDSYYLELNHLSLIQRAHWNFDAPDALDGKMLTKHVEQIALGEAVDKPIYDFTTHTRTGETHRLEPRDYIIVEGLFALYWEDVRTLLGTKVFVDLGEGECLERRIERDIRERGRTRESVLEQYETTVLPMARQYLHPTRAHADIVVTGDDDIAHEVAAVLAHISVGSGQAKR
jgi:uridine kinase